MKKFMPANVALESINFQSTMFFKELVLAFTELRKIGSKGIQECDELATLSAVVKHHTKLNVSFDIGLAGPCVDIPAVNKNNILINSFIRNYVSSADGIKLVAEAGGMVRGSVSLLDGTVSGVFEDVQSTIRLPVNFVCSSSYDIEEVAAVTLHEIGHLIVYYEYMSRSVTTNQALAGLSKALDGSGTVAHRETVLLSLKRSLKLKTLDEKELAKTTNNKVVEIVVLGVVARDCASELGSNVYDFSTWEALADAYVARQGAGRQLVTALEKIYKGSWNISFRNSVGFVAMEALKMTLVVGGIFTLTPIALTVGLTMMAMDASGDGTYNTPGVRIKRVRNQIIENLKQPKLDSEDKDRLLADLAAIDALLKSVDDRRQLMGVVWDVFQSCFSGARKQMNAEKLQEDLEAIAANDLFVKAVELKQLA